MKIKRQESYIEDVKGRVYFQRPTNWLSGWLRSRWFEHLTQQKSCIASPDYWETLLSLYIVRTLTEYEDGRTRVSESR